MDYFGTNGDKLKALGKLFSIAYVAVNHSTYENYHFLKRTEQGLLIYPIQIYG